MRKGIWGILRKGSEPRKRKIVSKNSKSFMEEKMVGGKWEGIYELKDGKILEAHEWDDWFDEEELEDGPEPKGAVYYDIYEKGTIVDGGVCGYNDGDKFSDIARFVKEGNKAQIVRPVAMAGSSEYSELYDALSSPEDYNQVKSKFGLKNKKNMNGKRGMQSFLNKLKPRRR